MTTSATRHPLGNAATASATALPPISHAWRSSRVAMEAHVLQGTAVNKADASSDQAKLRA